MKTVFNPDMSSFTINNDETLICKLCSHNPETQEPFVSEDQVNAFILSKIDFDGYWLPIDPQVNYETEWQEWQNKLEQEKLEFIQTEYQRQRAAEYPDFKDYLDGIVKGDKVQMKSYIDACLAVKTKYPKPE
jgi:hypothetical protein